MGKNKQAQRTKNNARPSSSGRSAELLGASMPNFVSFSAVKDGGYVPLLPGLSISTLDDFDISKLDSNFQLLFKKMNKKDGTTKLKALQEFTELCNNSTEKDIQTVLPFWPRIYCVLAIDVEHRVREAAHIAHLAIVKPAGRNIAPYLKQLAGPWFTSQYDTYAPAASAATNAFQETFPPNKLTDAIIHCQEEILTYICDNITIQTPQSLGNNKTVTSEELDMRYHRLLISSLQGYSLYLKTVSPKQMDKVINIHEKIISSNKFWKLAKHEVPLIRAGFFSVLSSMIQHNDELYKNEKKKLVTAVMNNLDETDPAVLPVVWEAVLIAICKIEDWHALVSLEKLLLPKLWHVLRDGGHGSASSIYPNLLPFISHFPINNVEKRNFYTNFFENLRNGFKVKSVQLSNSEMLAVATAFVECLRYVVLLNNDDQVLCETLLREQLMPTLEWCLSENTPIKGLLFNQISQLIRYWSKNRAAITEYKCYSHLVEEFWKELETRLFSLIESTKESFDCVEISNAHDSLLELLMSLKNTSAVPNRKNLRVKFFDPNKQQTERNEEVVSSKIVEDDLIYYSELTRLINKIISINFNNIEKTDSSILNNFYKLVSNFESKDLFITLAKDMSLFEFYNKHLKKWFINKSEQADIIVKLLFSMIKYLDEKDKVAVLNSLTEIEDKTVLRYAVECALSKCNRKEKAVKEWFSGPEVSSLLLDVAKQLISNESAVDLNINKNVLMLCFESSDTGDLIITDLTFNKIISILCDALIEKNQENVNFIAEILCDLSSVTWNHKHPGIGVLKIVETLFQLSCRDDSDPGVLHLSNNVQTTWENGLLEFKEKISSAEMISLTKKCSNILWEKILESKNVQLTEKLVNLASSFIKVLIEDDDDNEYTEDVIAAFISGKKITKWLSNVTTIVLYAELIRGNLFARETSFETIVSKEEITNINLEEKYPTDNIEECVKWALFNTKLLKNLFSEVKSDEKDNSEEEEDRYHHSRDIEIENVVSLIKKNALSIVKESINNLLYVIAAGYLYARHYTSTKYYNAMNSLLIDLRSEFKNTYTVFETEIRDGIFADIIENSRNYVGIWSHVLRLYCTELSPSDYLDTYFKNNFTATDTLEITEDQIGARLQAVQVLSDYLKLQDVPFQLDDDINSLVTSRSLLRIESGEEISQTFIATFEKMMKLYQEDSSFLFFDSDVSKISWEKCAKLLEIIKFLTKSITTMSTKLIHSHWDFILISLASWQLSVNKSRHNCDSLKVTAFIVAVNQLFRVLQELLNKHENEPIPQLPTTILDEWKNIFADDIYVVLIDTWMYCSNLCNQRSISSMQVILLDSFGEALKLIDDKIFFKKHNSLTLGSINSDRVIKLSFKLLQSPVPSLQLSAYQALKKVIPELVIQDKALIEKENFDPNLLNFKKFESVLSATQNIVNTMLLDFKLCETVSCTIQPFTDSYTYTLGYLFEWAILLDMCSYAHSELRYQYSESLKNDFFPSLMNNLFRLMPVEVLQDNKNKAAKLAEIFSSAPSFSFSDSWTEWRLDHLVCWLYANSLRQLPVLVRQWWGTADSRVSAAVERITTLYVSPLLCQEELQCNKLTDIENMQVKIHPTAREVIALYQVEDAKLELSIVLPINHPLGPVTVEPGQHAGGGANWRNCHMQLSIFLTHQNGSIWDGLTLWKNNLDKRFSGVEECYICFSIVHATTNQIPKLSCHTCRKKFHTPCLYKWFSTSQKSTCPICRNIF